MRVTVIFDDRCIGVNGTFYFFSEQEWTFDEDYHAIQWYTNHGEIELRTTDPNIEINDFSTISHFVDKWNEKHAEAQIKAEIDRKQQEHWLKLEKLKEIETRLEIERLEARLKEIESQME